ncbi:MAG: DEAD/DEAH box helicase, partial [Verrucomicrobiota bacterium]
DLLPALAGHPRLSLGRQTAFEVDPRPAPVPWRARLEPDGVITVALADARPPGGLVREGDQAWILEPRRLRRFPLPSAFAGILEAPLRIPRMQVPLFLAHGWPQLAELGPGDSDFAPGDFVLTPQPPRFLLQLSGGLAQLAGTLQCAYGPRVMTVGVTAREDGAWIPDPADPRRYSTRDLAAEQHALQRLRQAGFAGPNAQGQVQLVGQERVLAFFARDYPRLEKEWSVTLEERLERTTRQTFDRVTPQLRITSSGQQWFDLEVGYASEGGERLGPAELQQLLRGGGRRLRNGRIALLDSGAVEEIQQVLVDCTPAQSAAGDAVRYRMEARQAGYLQSSLREKGLALQAPAAWSDRSRRQAGEVSLECPPLGDLEPVLRPYQRHGVAWLRFLREQGFGGILADEMGLGKTLQVLAHLAAARRAPPPGAPPPAPSLVVCPSSLVFNWAAEAARWTPGLRVLALDGPQRHRLFERIPQHDLLVTSYALIRRDLDRYRDLELDTVILDEAQHIKNRATRNAQAVKSLRSTHRLVLTGTPLENSILDLWSLLDFLMPGYLGTADDFRERYEVAITRERD